MGKFDMMPGAKKPVEVKKEEGPLSIDEAQDEANMISAKLGVDPRRHGKVFETETGNWVSLDKGKPGLPTEEEYKNAQLQIEEMKKLAGEEPSIKHALSKIAQFILYIDKPIPMDDKIYRDTTKAGEIIKKLDSAKTKFDDLKKSGEKFGRIKSNQEEYDAFEKAIFDVVRVTDDGTKIVKPKVSKGKEYEVLEEQAKKWE